MEATSKDCRLNVSQPVSSQPSIACHLIDAGQCDVRKSCVFCKETDGKETRVQSLCTTCQVYLHPKCFIGYHKNMVFVSNYVVFIVKLEICKT